MSRRIGLGQRICSGQSLFNMVNKTLILDLQTLFKVTVHLRLEALWRWRMNQNGLRGGKTYAPDKWFRTDRLTDRLINIGHLQSGALTINGYKHLLHFPLNFFSLSPLKYLKQIFHWYFIMYVVKCYLYPDTVLMILQS